MFTELQTSTQLLAAEAPINEVSNLWGTLTTNILRTLIALATAIAILVFGFKNKEDGALGKVSTISTIVGFLGGFWLAWYIYNRFTNSTLPLLGADFPVQNFSDYWSDDVRTWTVVGLILLIIALGGIRGLIQYVVAITAFIGAVIIGGFFV